ncbi:ribonucleotide reductase [Lanmaoa asiatica]|nr:ribonucleotide reductase [Lanmaoa asiatica]
MNPFSQQPANPHRPGLHFYLDPSYRVSYASRRLASSYGDEQSDGAGGACHRRPTNGELRGLAGHPTPSSHGKRQNRQSQSSTGTIPSNRRRSESASTNPQILPYIHIHDWNTRLNDNERHFISHVLAFFAASDGIINGNLVKWFSNEVQAAEARYFYGFRIMMENIRSGTYLPPIGANFKDPAQREYLYDAMDTIPCVKRKAE